MSYKQTVILVGVASITLLTVLSPTTTSASADLPPLGGYVLSHDLVSTGPTTCSGTIRIAHAPVPNTPLGRIKAQVNPGCTVTFVRQDLSPSVAFTLGESVAVTGRYVRPNEAIDLELNATFSFQPPNGCPAPLAAGEVHSHLYRAGRPFDQSQPTADLEPLPIADVPNRTANACDANYRMTWTELSNNRQHRMIAYWILDQPNGVHPTYIEDCRPHADFILGRKIDCFFGPPGLKLPEEPGSQYTWGPAVNLPDV